MMAPVDAVRKLWTKTGWSAGRRGPRRAERGLRGAGRRRLPRAGASIPAKVNVNGGAVALGHPDRRERRARPHDAALRPAGPRQEARHRDAVPGRRQRRGPGRRARLDERVSVAVLGAGTMGNGIAQVFAQHGHEVIAARPRQRRSSSELAATIDKSLAQARREGQDRGRASATRPWRASRTATDLERRRRAPTWWSRRSSRTSQLKTDDLPRAGPPHGARTRSSPPTPPRSRSPSWARPPGGPTRSSACTS